MKKTLLLSMALPIVMLFASCSQDEFVDTEKIGTLTIAVNNSGGKTKSSETLKNVTHALISIKRNGKTYEDFDLKKIKISNWGDGKLVSDEIRLIVESGYELVRFELQNKDNHTLYATPLKGSPLAAKVNKPLAISFSVSENETTPLEIEVLSTASNIPGDFGFVQFMVKIIDGIEKDMVLVKGGTYNLVVPMKASLDTDNDVNYKISLDDFYIGKYEVTQEQWLEMMGTKPQGFVGGKYPVANITKAEVLEFIKKLNAKTGEKYRLPTEAEWFYAARGGSKSKNYLFAGSNHLDKVAWNENNSDGKAHPVGQKLANELGLFDMSGNVREYCSDTYKSLGKQLKYDELILKNPENKKGDRNVTRGGSFIRSNRDFFRLDKFAHHSPGVGIGINRIVDYPGTSAPFRGFRLVKNR